MLIALFTILFLGGSTNTGMLDFIADSQEAVKEIVQDNDRRKASLALIKEMKKRSNTRYKMVDRASKDMRGALASDDGIDAIWEDYFDQRSAYNLDMLDLRDQLKSQMTREEWHQVFGER